MCAEPNTREATTIPGRPHSYYRVPASDNTSLSNMTRPNEKDESIFLVSSFYVIARRRLECERSRQDCVNELSSHRSMPWRHRYRFCLQMHPEFDVIEFESFQLQASRELSSASNPLLLAS